MAALALALALAGRPDAPARAQEPTTPTAVRLQLQITGVSPAGCVVEIRPGHPGCKFTPVARKVAGYAGGETVRLDPITIVPAALGADRDCSFAITVREPDMPPRTFRRGLRMAPTFASEVAGAHVLNVYLSTPSLALKTDDANRTRR
jgi:hypothetical protein